MPHTLHLVRPDGVHLVSPESLRAHVEHGGGTIIREFDYRDTPDQGGDGERGKLTIYFADATGKEIGNIGFSRWSNRDGTPGFRAVDFQDYRRDRHYGDGGWIHRYPEKVADMLAVFPPIPYEG